MFCYYILTGFNSEINDLKRIWGGYYPTEEILKYNNNNNNKEKTKEFYLHTNNGVLITNCSFGLQALSRLFG